MFAFKTPSTSSPQEEQVKEWLSTSSEKGFIENRGQMKDNEGNPIPFVLFKSEAPGINFGLLKQESPCKRWR
jgi:hypothetical protein